MRTKILELLLNGKITTDFPEEPILKEYGIGLYGKCFAVFSMTVEDAGFSEVFTDDKLIAEKVIAEISEELSKKLENVCVYAYRTDGAFAGVICFLESLPDKERLISGMDALCASLEQRMRRKIICGVSPLTEHISQLAAAYEKAREILCFRLVRYEKRVYFYDDDLSDAELPSYTAECENNLMNSVLSGNADVALNIINRMLHFDGDMKCINLGTLFVLSTQIIHTLLEASHRIKDVEWREYKEMYLLPLKIDSMHRFEDVKRQISAFAQELCRHSRDMCQDRKKQTYDNIAVYINENYLNPELNVNRLVSEFYVDRSWMSRRFKEAFGVGISEYIINLRLKKAKELLKTDMNINHVAREAGFTNHAALRYNFKKHEKLTPAQYRKILVK